MVATLALADELDVGRGDLIVAPADAPEVARELDATRLLDGRGARPRRGALPAQAHDPARPGEHRPRSRRASTSTSFEAAPTPTSSASTTSGACSCAPRRPSLADPYAANRATGAFILIDERTHDTVAAGMVEAARAGGAAELEHSPDIRWHPSALERSVRWSSTGQRGATVWLTGLPASGKSTIAVAVERALVESGPLRLPARRRQPPPRAVGRPRLRPGLALGEHPPRGARRAAVRRRGRGGRRLAGLPVPRGPARSRGGCTRRRASRSWRCSSTRRSRSARGATRRACTHGPAPAG